MADTSVKLNFSFEWINSLLAVRNCEVCNADALTSGCTAILLQLPASTQLRITIASSYRLTSQPSLECHALTWTSTYKLMSLISPPSKGCQALQNQLLPPPHLMLQPACHRSHQTTFQHSC